MEADILLLVAFAGLPEVSLLWIAINLSPAAISRRACYRSKKMRQPKRLTHFLLYILGDSYYTSQNLLLLWVIGQ